MCLHGFCYITAGGQHGAMSGGCLLSSHWVFLTSSRWGPGWVYNVNISLLPPSLPPLLIPVSPPGSPVRGLISPSTETVASQSYSGLPWAVMWDMRNDSTHAPACPCGPHLSLQDTVSVHRPSFYAERFFKFMSNTVFRKNSCELPWSFGREGPGL